MGGEVVTIACAVVLLSGARAEAGTFHGSTSRGQSVSLKTNANGEFRSLIIHWRGGCRQVGAVYKTQTRFREPIRHQSKTSIGEHGFYLVGNPKRIGAKVHVTMTGRRLSLYRWKGTFTADAVVRKHNRVIDECKTPPLRWHASIPQVHVHMEGDSDDYILGGQTIDTQTPQDSVPFTGTKTMINTGAGPYGIEIVAPGHKTLHTGVSFKTTRYPFNGRGGGLDVSGDGRGCNQSTGTVTVDRAKFDSRGAVISMQVRFEQHCEGGSAALHGVIVYRR